MSNILMSIYLPLTLTLALKWRSFIPGFGEVKVTRVIVAFHSPWSSSVALLMCTLHAFRVFSSITSSVILPSSTLKLIIDLKLKCRQLVESLSIMTDAKMESILRN